MVYEKFNRLTDDRIVASLIGMPKSKFTSLVKAFESAFLEIDQAVRKISAEYMACMG